MKKLLCVILTLALSLSCFACTQKQNNVVTPVNSDTLYKTCLTLLNSGGRYITASCPLSRETLNASVVLTPSMPEQISQIFSKFEPQPVNAARVPGNSEELEIVFGQENGMRVLIYNLTSENSALIWLQNGEQRFQLSADIALYNELKELLDGAVVTAEPSYDGEYISAQLLPGRDIFRGVAEEKDTVAAAFASYDGKGYVDFYNRLTGELLSSLSFEQPLYRLDTGKKGDVRVFYGGKMCYLSLKKQEIKSEFLMPIKDIDSGDSFDVDEKLGIIAYAQRGTVFISAINGEHSMPVMLSADLQRALPTESLKRLEAEEAVVLYKSPRFLNKVLTATAAGTLMSQPLLALSSFPLPDDIAKKLADEEYVAEITENYTVMHFPNLFGTMGTMLGYSFDTAIVSSDLGVTFSNMLSGEEWQLPNADGQRIVVLSNGYVCTQTQELPENGVRNRVDISSIISYSEKTQVFAASATPLSVLGGTKTTLVIREGTSARLLFVDMQLLTDKAE